MQRLFTLLLVLLLGCGTAGATNDDRQPTTDNGARPTRAQAARVPAHIPPSPTSPPSPTATPTPAPPRYSYPIGLSGRAVGDGFFVRHGYTVENTWYNPGYWHTGEDWYAVTGDTAGARVYTIAAGEVVYAGANYPGRVVIIQHPDGLYSMYGHLDPRLAVRVGQRVARGALLGTVLRRGDRTPNHLHFEVRTFLFNDAVNGARPRYGFRCGRNCPPGPGYWPRRAPDLPSDLGYRNATHVINGRAFVPNEGAPLGNVLVVAQPVSPTVALWSEVPGVPGAQQIGERALQPGATYPLLAVRVGPEDSRAPSATGYTLWYRLALPDGTSGWVQAAVATTFDTGSDRRPSTVSFNFVPAISAE